MLENNAVSSQYILIQNGKKYCCDADDNNERTWTTTEIRSRASTEIIAVSSNVERTTATWQSMDRSDS